MEHVLNNPRRSRSASSAQLLALALVLPLALLLALALPMSFGTNAARATGCAGEVSAFSFAPGAHVVDGRFRSGADGLATVRFAWAVDPAAEPGNRFTLDLPNELTAVSSKDMILTAPDGSEVARGTWSGKTATFTLSEYAREHGRISGTAYFSVAWDRGSIGPDSESRNLEFRGCRGAGSLDGDFVASGPAGNAQANAKVGVLDRDGASTRWNIYVETASHDQYHPLIIEDRGGEGFELSCAKASVMNRTPISGGPIDDTPISTDRWRCEENGRGGLRFTFLPLSDGRYLAAGESLMIGVEGPTTPTMAELDALVNTATISNGPEGALQSVEGRIELPTAGGEGSGHRASFSVTKRVEGPEPTTGAAYAFEYRCRGDRFVVLDSVSAGSTSRTISTHSAATCEVREASVPEGTSVSFAVSGVRSEAIENGVRLFMDRDAVSTISITATNTFPTPPTPDTPQSTPSPSSPRRSVGALARTGATSGVLPTATALAIAGLLLLARRCSNGTRKD